MDTISSAYPSDPPVRALLVDRDPDTRFLYAQCLKGRSWQVDEAADGPSALAKAIASMPDVIVTDTRLPGFDGFALCSLLQRDVGTTDIPVVFVTGDAFATDIAHCKEVGASLVLTKPCLPDRLVKELKAVVEHSRQVRARAEEVRRTAQARLAHADDVLSRAVDTVYRRPTLKNAHHRGYTINPPIAPLPLVCPECVRALKYQRSHIGGVSSKDAEQWDYFECRMGCGTFQYRVRTKKLRKVS
jgi:two-component system, cell cycle response regulator DivK